MDFTDTVLLENRSWVIFLNNMGPLMHTKPSLEIHSITKSWGFFCMKRQGKTSLSQILSLVVTLQSVVSSNFKFLSIPLPRKTNRTSSKRRITYKWDFSVMTLWAHVGTGMWLTYAPPDAADKNRWCQRCSESRSETKSEYGALKRISSVCYLELLATFLVVSVCEKTNTQTSIPGHWFLLWLRSLRPPCVWTQRFILSKFPLWFVVAMFL